MKKSTIKFIVLIAFIIAAFLLVRALGITEALDEETLRASIKGFGLLAPLVFILIYTIAPSLLFPGLPLTIAAGILFGPYFGVVYTIFGATIGASVAFFIARRMGRDFITERIKGVGKDGGRWAELDKKAKEQGWKIVAITRLIPLFPFNILNYAFGLTSIKPFHYIWASFVFMLPGTIAYVVFSSSLLKVIKGELSNEFIVGLVLIIVLSIVPFIYKKHFSKK